MALDLKILTQEIKKVLDPETSGLGFPKNKVQVADRWANAYDIYAKDAEDLSGDKLIDTGNKAKFRIATLAALPSVSLSANTEEIDTSVQMANALAKGFVAYWTKATFGIGKLVPGIGTGECPNAGGNKIFGIELISIVSVVENQILLSGKGSENGLKAEFKVLSGNNIQAKAQAFATAFHNATIAEVKVLISGTDTTVSGPLPISNTCTIS